MMNLYFTSLHEVSMSKFKLFTKVCVSLLFPFLCLLVVSCSGGSSDNVDGGDNNGSTPNQEESTNPDLLQECTDTEIADRCTVREQEGIGN